MAGLGIALLPTILTISHIKTGRLQKVPSQYGHSGVGVYLVYLSRRQLPRAVKAFIEFATEKIPSHGVLGRDPFASVV
jgi:DNA-binding transcriptional LysR family regulator